MQTKTCFSLLRNTDSGNQEEGQLISACLGFFLTKTLSLLFSTPLMQIDGGDTSRYRCQIRSGSFLVGQDSLGFWGGREKLLAIHADICGFSAAESNCILVIEQVNA